VIDEKSAQWIIYTNKDTSIDRKIESFWERVGLTYVVHGLEKFMVKTICKGLCGCTEVFFMKRSALFMEDGTIYLPLQMILSIN